MNTKDKARELVDRFYKKFSWLLRLCTPSRLKEESKQCALIAVDEIMKSGCTQPSGVSYYGDNEEATKYWQELKEEINNV